MRVSARALAFGCVSILLAASVPRAHGTSDGWPKGYEIAADTMSPDGRLAVLLPTRAEAEDKDEDQISNLLVDLGTHARLAAIRGAHYFPGQNHRGLEATWASDSSWCVVTYEARYGFGNITAIRIRDGARAQFDLGRHIQKALDAVIARQAAKSSADCEGSAHFRSAANGKILVRATGFTNPKGFEDQQTFCALFQGTFDIATGKWTRSEAREIDCCDALELAYSDSLVTEGSGLANEQRLQWYDGRLNDVYQAVRAVLPADRFATVKKAQIAWLQRLESIGPADEKCVVIAARIKELQQLLW